MATVGANVITLADRAKSMDPDGKESRIINLLSQTNEIIEDASFIEGNLPTGHRYTTQTGGTTARFRRFNEGIPPSKGTTTQVDASAAMLEDWSEVDKDLAELNGNTSAFRLSQARMHLEGMNQEFAATLIYGSTATAPQEIDGFARHTSAISGATNADYVISGLGSDSADQTSIYFVGWGENTVTCFYPKGSKAGLLHEDLGLVTVETTAGVAGNRMRAYQDHWQWKFGLAVQDYRYLVRIANIDVSNLTAESTPADIEKLMIRAYHRFPSYNGIKPAIYMNRTVFSMLDIQRLNYVRSASISYETISGRLTPTFRGIPIRLVDQILNSEDAVA